jgi:hypothetical protein
MDPSDSLRVGLRPGECGPHPTEESPEPGEEQAPANSVWRVGMLSCGVGEGEAMKKALWWVGGFCAAAAGFLVLGARRVQPALADQSEEAREDQQSVA